MKHMFFSVLLIAGCVSAVSIIAADAAQGSSRKRTLAMVRSAEAQQAQLLAQAPRLREIDSAIRFDCAEKNAGVTSEGKFCGCAAAVTMMLWRSGADPQMVPRLLDFANRRGEAMAQSFLTYQGPELYRPLCSVAVAR